MTADAPEVLIDEAAIRARVAALAARISADYADAKDGVLLIGVLKGAFVFLADLARAMTVPREIEFIAVSSYEHGAAFSGAVRLIMDVRGDIEGRHVLIVEDILDTGHTLAYLMRVLAARRPASLRTCVLLRKRESGAVEPTVDYLGFEIDDVWVVGYGLDYDERYRTLPYIGVIDPDTA